MQKMKKSSIAILTIILLIVFASMIAVMPIQPVQAQLAAQQPVSGPLPSGTSVDISVETRPFLSFRPNPIGVGQQLLVNMWLNPALASNERFIPEGFKVTITKPDGTEEVIGLMDSEPATAAAWFEYVPDEVGEYKLKFEFIGCYFPAGRYVAGYITTATTGGAVYGSAYYKPSATAEQTLTVQNDIVYSWPAAAFPTDYWTRPGSLNNREWWPILGNYPATGYVGGGAKWDELYPNTNPHDSPGRYEFIPWVQAPNSAHIVWKQQGSIAGLIGGMAGQYGTTSSPGSPSVVYAGRCYQTRTVPINGVPTSCAVCYDLRTGEQYYAIPTAQVGVTPSYLGYNSPAQDSLATGTWSVELLTISGGRLLKINPLTGAVTANVSISPLTGTGGLYYMNGYVLSVQDLGANVTTGRYRLINWTTIGTSATFASRVTGNVSWPWANLPNQYTSGSGVCVADFNVGIAALITRTSQVGTGIFWGTNVTAADMRTGQLLGWKVTLPDEATYSASCVVADHGKVAFLTQRGYWLAYDLRTGKQAWKSEVMDYPWGAPSFGAYAMQSAYGMFFRQSYDGVYAFDWETGKIVWKYVAPALASFESPYITDGQEHYSFNGGAEIADGKMYVYNTEHTPSWPMTRGWGLHCINITTGELLWKVSNPMVQGAIADGYLTASNSWDGYMYVFGKGKSATTIEAPLTAVTLGQTVVLKGSVLDRSPAQPGTACVSKQSMGLQMDYVHLQMPIGGLWGNETITGVSVSLDTLDPNGNYVHIGDVTTNGYTGTFGFTWEPEVPGQYEVTATFMGDDSYSSSVAATYVTVSEAPAATATPVPVEKAPDYTGLLYALLAVGIIAIVLILVVLLRKR